MSTEQKSLGIDAPADDLHLSPAFSAEFFDRTKHELARRLLGRILVRRIDGELVAGRIVEVEAYGGPHDPASHADSGSPTDRTASMFGDPGDLYVYQIYGRYHCLNVVAPAETKAAAVLIRALEPLVGLDRMAEGRGLRGDYDTDPPRSVRRNLASGPGKICQALRIDRSLDGADLFGDRIWIAPGDPVAKRAGGASVETTPRIGLNPETVGEAAEWDWRYVVADSPYLSR